MGQINTNNYPTVNSLLDADLLIVENATHGTGTTTPKQLRENAIGTDTLHTSAQSVTGAINELKHEIDLGAGVARYDVNTITSGYLGQFSGSANLLLLHLTTDGIADATNGYMMMLSYSRPVARFAYGRLVDTGGAAYKQDVYADNTIICTISGSGEGTESDPVQVVILGIINAGFMLTPTAVVSDRDIIDGQGNTLSVLAEALTKTASGNPVEISDCAGGKARSLVTTIEAAQDLHGYDHPWAGGAYKNFIDYSARHNTTVGVSYTDNPYSGELKVDYVGGVAQHQLVLSVPNVDKLKGQQVTISVDSVVPSNSRTNDWRIFLLSYINGASESIVATLTSSTLKGTITLADNITEMRLLLRMSQGGSSSLQSGDYVTFNKVQLELGGDKTSYAPYSNICPISGRSSVVLTRSDGDEISEDFTIQLGQTVYGADINWDTGVMAITYAFIIYDGSSDEEWSASLAGSGGGYRCRTNTPTGAKIPSNNGETANIVCNQFKADTANRTYMGNEGISIQNGGGNPLDVYSVSFNTSDISLWKTYLSNNPLQVCYELATPQTIQLTPEQLQMLKGYNRVTIESGSIELGYIAKLT